MITFTIPKRIDAVGNLQIRGEKFLVIKKEYMDELFLLMQSFTTGERLFREGKTRSFTEFLKSISSRKK